MKKIIVILMLIIMIPATAGCWNRREMNTLGILDSIVYGLKGDKIQLTAEVINDSAQVGSSENTKKTKIVSSEGNTSAEALRNITLGFNRKLFLSFVNVRFFSEDIAVNSLQNVMDFLLRDHEIRETSYIVVLKKENADKLYSCSPQLSNSIGDYIKNLENSQMNSTSKSVFVETIDFLRAYYREGLEPVMGLAQVMEKRELMPTGESNGASGSSSPNFSLSSSSGMMSGSMTSGRSSSEQSKSGGQSMSGGQSQGTGGQSGQGSQSSLGQSQGGQGGQSQKEYELHYEGLAAFKGIHLVGYLNGEEARDYNIIVNRMRSSFITIPNNKSVFEVIDCNTSIKTKLVNNKVMVEVKPKLRVVLAHEPNPTDVVNISVKLNLEKMLSDYMQSEISNTITKVQKTFKSDIFGFGQFFNEQNIKDWVKLKDKWNNYFEAAQVKVNVEANIVRIGKIKNPLNAAP